MLARIQETTTTPSRGGFKFSSTSTQGGRGAYDCNCNFTHVSSYTQNTKEEITLILELYKNKIREGRGPRNNGGALTILGCLLDNRGPT